MIKARLYKDKKNKDAYRLTIKGHSGIAPSGADLVCACATTAAYQLAQVAQEMYDAGKLAQLPKRDIRQGTAKISLCPKPEFAAETEHALYVVCTALRLLAHNYPRAVSFTDDLCPDRA